MRRALHYDDVLLAYGLQNAALVHVTDVARGRACGCVCVLCQRPLVAKQGRVRVAHFAHDNASDCDGGIETILHRLAIELFPTITALTLPEYRFTRVEIVGTQKVSYSVLLRPKKTVHIAAVQVEPRLEGFVPDLIVSSGQRNLIVEIAVSHRVDALKKTLIVGGALPVMEVRLTPRDSRLSRVELRHKLATDVHSKHWLFHPNERVHEERFRARVDEERQRHEAENREHAQFLREALNRVQRARYRPGPRATAQTELGVWESFVAEFFQAHNRLPKLSESQGFFNKLRSRGKPRT